MYLFPICHPDEPFPENGCWQPYALSEDEDGENCDLRNQLATFDQAYIDDFFAWLRHFQQLCTAHPRRPLKELIRDSDKFHSVGTISVESWPGVTTEEKVWQFTHGRIRVMWCYAGDGRILLLGRVLIKKTQKTKKSDVTVVKKAMQAYLDAQRDGVLKILAGD